MTIAQPAGIADAQTLQRVGAGRLCTLVAFGAYRRVRGEMVIPAPSAQHRRRAVVAKEPGVEVVHLREARVRQIRRVCVTRDDQGQNDRKHLAFERGKV
jgi:hypothetical protein